MIWLLPNPSPISKLDGQYTGRVRKRDNLLTGESGGGWGRGQILRPRESLVFNKSLNTLWFNPNPFGVKITFSAWAGEPNFAMPPPPPHPTPATFAFVLNRSIKQRIVVRNLRTIVSTVCETLPGSAVGIVWTGQGTQASWQLGLDKYAVIDSALLCD